MLVIPTTVVSERRNRRTNRVNGIDRKKPATTATTVSMMCSRRSPRIMSLRLEMYSPQIHAFCCRQLAASGTDIGANLPGYGSWRATCSDPPRAGEQGAARQHTADRSVGVHHDDAGTLMREESGERLLDRLTTSRHGGRHRELGGYVAVGAVRRGRRAGDPSRWLVRGFSDDGPVGLGTVHRGGRLSCRCVAWHDWPCSGLTEVDVEHRQPPQRAVRTDEVGDE